MKTLRQWMTIRINQRKRLHNVLWLFLDADARQKSSEMQKNHTTRIPITFKNCNAVGTRRPGRRDAASKDAASKQDAPSKIILLFENDFFQVKMWNIFYHFFLIDTR